MILQKTIRSRSSRARSLLRHRPKEYLWHKLLDLHHQLGDREDGPFRGLQGAAEEIVEVNDDENEVVIGIRQGNFQISGFAMSLIIHYLEWFPPSSPSFV